MLPPFSSPCHILLSSSVFSLSTPSQPILPITLLRSLTERASPLGGASTRETINAIGTRSSILTGVARALIDILVTVHAFPARVAVADVARI